MVVVLTSSATAWAATEEKHFTLELAVEMNTSPTIIVCTLRNTGKVDVETTPFATNYNRLVIIDASGKEEEMFAWKDGIEPVVIKPSQSSTSKVALEDCFERRKIEIPGTYRIYWKVAEVKSNELKISIPEKKE